MSKNIWNVKRQEINKFFRLSNNQWLKIVFSYKSSKNIWIMDIVVANSKRQCNDCVRKTEFSPKVFYGQSTGRKLGLEPFRIALRELLWFEKTISNTQINIVGANNRLNNIYKYLKRYGYKEVKLEQRNLLIKKIHG